MKALIHENKIIQVAEEEFPVHPNFSWAEIPKDLDPKEPIKVESEDVFEDREVVDETTGETVTRPVFIRKDFTLLRDVAAIEEEEAERLTQAAEEERKAAEQEAVRDFTFEGTTIAALRTELNAYRDKISALLGIPAKNGGR